MRIQEMNVERVYELLYMREVDQVNEMIAYVEQLKRIPDPT